MKVVTIIQARMTSERLPGKVLFQVVGRPLLSYMLERIAKVEHCDEVVVATTTNAEDQPVVDICEQIGVSCFRGSEHDVLARYYETARQSGADIIVRLTADCPLMDPSIVDQSIVRFVKDKEQLNYLSNGRKRTFPRGMDVEVFSFSALEKAYHEAKDQYDREHVTPYIYHHMDQEKVGHFINPNGDMSDLRITIDYQEDFELISNILAALYPMKHDFHLQDILDIVKANPNWPKINAHIR